ncbi:MAG: hypothetical protein WCC84_12940, partial [Candidatus Cybelea sp.]
MKILALSRHAVCIGVAAALLARCGGSQPLIGAPGAMPQSHAIATHAERGGSWMLPEAKRNDLLYANVNGYLYVFTYPRGKLLKTIGGLDNPGKLCSDTNGNVWVITGSGSGPGTLVEYAHGGKTPIQTLADPSAPQDCSVDPTTGNLAVANGCYSGTCQSNLAVYAHATGTPTLYTVPYGPAYSCTYDNAGNVFVAAFEDVYKTGTLWLPAGGSTVSKFRLIPHPYPHVGVQWDGRSLAVEISHATVYQYTL